MKEILLNIIKEHELVNICQKMFLTNLENYKKESFEEYSKNIGQSDVKTNLNRFAYIILRESDEECIEIRLDIIKGNNAIGHYSLIVSHSNYEIIDDYFVIW